MVLLENFATLRFARVCNRAGVPQIEKGVVWTVHHPLAGLYWPETPIERSVGQNSSLGGLASTKYIPIHEDFWKFFYSISEQGGTNCESVLFLKSESWTQPVDSNGNPAGSPVLLNHRLGNIVSALPHGFSHERIQRPYTRSDFQRAARGYLRDVLYYRPSDSSARGFCDLVPDFRQYGMGVGINANFPRDESELTANSVGFPRVELFREINGRCESDASNSVFHLVLYSHANVSQSVIPQGPGMPPSMPESAATNWPSPYAPEPPSRPKPNAPAAETSSKGLGTGITAGTLGAVGAVGIGFSVATCFKRWKTWKTMLATTRLNVRVVELTSATPDPTISTTTRA